MKTMKTNDPCNGEAPSERHEIDRTPQTDAIAQNFHVIAATEKIQVAQYVKAWQCREIEEQVNHWKGIALQEQRRWAVVSSALRGLLNATQGEFKAAVDEAKAALENPDILNQ